MSVKFSRDSSNYSHTMHSKRRTRERNILEADIEEVIEKGEVEGARRGKDGEIKIELHKEIRREKIIVVITADTSKVVSAYCEDEDSAFHG